MATVPKRLYKGSLTNQTALTVYTVPTNTTTMVKAVTICNGGSTTNQFSLFFAGVAVIGSHVIKANDTITIPFLDQLLLSGETIVAQLGASSPSIHLYISGKEVT
ncbi:hypothetical protein [Paenibacillus xylanexedens]|uniref:hypothetical protein n=1 Tax=Paenibacillus xylanexedens TaxID=528191 RepID=UPI0011A100A2|nr:hypothetical protein [Paenibacillus xylanexedens]